MRPVNDIDKGGTIEAIGIEVELKAVELEEVTELVD
jgi:hypothetical protein